LRSVRESAREFNALRTVPDLILWAAKA